MKLMAFRKKNYFYYQHYLLFFWCKKSASLYKTSKTFDNFIVILFFFLKQKKFLTKKRKNLVYRQNLIGHLGNTLHFRSGMHRLFYRVDNYHHLRGLPQYQTILLGCCPAPINCWRRDLVVNYGRQTLKNVPMKATIEQLLLLIFSDCVTKNIPAVRQNYCKIEAND